MGFSIEPLLNTNKVSHRITNNAEKLGVRHELIVVA